MKRLAYVLFVIALGNAFIWATADERVAAQRRGGPPQQPSGPWPPAKLKDGQPNVQGYWQAAGQEGAAGLTIEALPNMMNMKTTAPTVVVDPPDGMIPYLPWARVRRDEVKDHHLSPNKKQVDTRNRGWPDGVPRITYYSVNPFQIIQPNGAVVILYEAQHEFRYIPLDSRPQIDDGVKLWMGSSRGHWEGTTLVVNVANMNDRIRFSVAGDFASDQVKVTERWKFVDADTITHQATFVDPNVYTRPWTIQKTIKRVRDRGFEIMEYSGVEGDKDQYLMVDIPANTAPAK